MTDESRRRTYDRLGHERFVDRESGEVADADRPPSTPSRATDPGRGRGDCHEVVDARLGPLGVGWGRWPAHRGVDLESAIGVRRDRPWGRVSPSTDRRPPEDPADPCPRCQGRGAFVHDIDTGLGRRRRLETCETCGGTGTVAG